MDDTHIIIDDTLVRRVIATQFPQWKDLPIKPIALSGWDNRTFHLGRDMVVRMPSREEYASQVEKEQLWLTKLAPLLPLQIPTPLAIGQPEESYPWKWSIYRWIEGALANRSNIADLNDFAASLAQFLATLQRIDTTDGPLPGPHNFYRGGALFIYDAEVRQALITLKARVEVPIATEVWERALATTWQHLPVWIHGDISVGNLLVKDGVLTAVIDFGQLGIGDPACDLMIAWTLFKGHSREIFQSTLSLDADTWARSRGWALWKALMYIVTGRTEMNFEAKQSWQIIEEVIEAHKHQS